MKRYIKASVTESRYKDYLFYIDMKDPDSNLTIIDTRTGQTYVTREIQPDDIMCVIKAYPDGAVVTPIEENMITLKNASRLGATDILDYLDGRLV